MSASSSSRRGSNSFFTRLRKRQRGEDDEESVDDHSKRTRRSSLIGEDRFIGPRLSASFREREEAELSPLSASFTHPSSHTGLTRTLSGYSFPPSSRASSEAGSSFSEGHALLRSASWRDSASAKAPPRIFNENSAHHHMRATNTTIDFSLPKNAAKDGGIPVAWSWYNAIIFSRSNIVHVQSLVDKEEIVQLCKLRDSQGALRVIASAGKDQPTIIALGTSKGLVQVWDIQTKKMVTNWSASRKAVTAMAWKGSILTVGTAHGTIRHYDTNIKDATKMKEEAKQVTRHKAQITCLAWNSDGSYLASGDASGCVYAWDNKQRPPLDVGELDPRGRRKMQHDGPIRAIAWCPWMLKMFASGDAAPNGKSTIRIWNVSNPEPLKSRGQGPPPTMLEVDAQVTSLHFSPTCKELLSTHGSSRPTEPSNVPDIPAPPVTRGILNLALVHHPSSLPPEVASRFANSVAIHSWPRLTEVKVDKVAATDVASSVLSPNELRVVMAVPEESKLQVWDVWGQRELRRAASCLDPRIR